MAKFDELIADMSNEEKIGYISKYKKQLKEIVLEKDTNFLNLDIDEIKNYNKQINKLLIAISKLENSIKEQSNEDSIFLGCGSIDNDKNIIPLFIKQEESNFIVFQIEIEELKNYYLFLHLKQIIKKDKTNIVIDYVQPKDNVSKYINLAKEKQIEHFFYISSNNVYISTPINVFYKLSNKEIINVILSLIEANDKDREIIVNILTFILKSLEFIEIANGYNNNSYKELIYRYEKIKLNILLKEKYNNLSDDFDLIKIKDEYNQNILNNILSFKEYENILKYSRTFVNLKDIFSFSKKGKIEKLFKYINELDINSDSILKLEQIKSEIENLYMFLQNIDNRYFDFLFDLLKNIIYSEFGNLLIESKINLFEESINNFILIQTNNNKTSDNLFINLFIAYLQSYLLNKDNLNLLLNNIHSEEIFNTFFYELDKKNKVLNFNYIFDRFSLKDEFKNNFNFIKL